jgi:predicted dehydrogenase
MAKVGIIGTGWGTRVQVPAFRRAGLEVVAIAGRDRDKTDALAKKLQVEHAFSDWRELIDLEGLDLITIVTPPFQHLEMTSAALEAGRHVLGEKPTALDADEARRLLELARRSDGQIALIDHELRFLPAWRMARERIGEIGEILWAEARYASPSRNDPQRPWNWWFSEEHGGGVLGAVGSHLIDAFRYFIGEIVEVKAALETLIRQRPDSTGRTREVTSDDWAAFDLRFESGALASVLLSVVAGVDETTSITIHGTKGSIRLVEDRFLLAEVGGEWRDQIERSEEPMRGDSPGGWFGSGTVELGRALRSAIDDGDLEAIRPGATFEDGLRQQQTLDAARRSSRNGGCWEEVHSS